MVQFESTRVRAHLAAAIAMSRINETAEQLAPFEPAKPPRRWAGRNDDPDPTRVAVAIRRARWVRGCDCRDSLGALFFRRARRWSTLSAPAVFVNVSTMKGRRGPTRLSPDAAHIGPVARPARARSQAPPEDHAETLCVGVGDRLHETQPQIRYAGLVGVPAR